MKKEYFLPVVFLIPAIFIQIIFVPIIALEGIIPDLVLILIVYFALRLGRIFGMAFGFFAGLALDLVTGGLLGGAMFAKTLAGFVAGSFFGENKILLNLKTYRFPMIVLLCGVLNSLAMFFISSFDIRVNFIDILISRGLLPAFYTAFISVLATFIHPGRVLE